MFSKFMVYMLTLVLGSLAGSIMVLGNAASMDDFNVVVGASFGIYVFHMVSRFQHACVNFNQDIFVTWCGNKVMLCHFQKPGTMLPFLNLMNITYIVV